MATERRRGFKELLDLMERMKADQLVASTERQSLQITLSRLVADLEAEKTTRSKERHELMDAVHKIRLFIDGDDGNSPGLKGRLQRLEDAEANRRWHFRIIWTAVVGSLITTLYALIGKNHGS